MARRTLPPFRVIIVIGVRWVLNIERHSNAILLQKNIVSAACRRIRLHHKFAVLPVDRKPPVLVTWLSCKLAQYTRHQIEFEDLFIEVDWISLFPHFGIEDYPFSIGRE